ncbi:ribosome small subunit-dependent GTPase A [Cohnella sp. JJ-181]|uniref:ribosome small subunit-dependent GTPase A n=1 Tax=Cohnella rhizoplanae TaxID=2974897 RepID=UPI0022FFADAB|nr:ribosome small subunit-dependent GTPase A [Cohnella sp. JJ-181]CAI6078169.1 Small ribosomal subunit biogenesis GTPase RsgA [Cohnella sp. JJ-181]
MQTDAKTAWPEMEAYGWNEEWEKKYLALPTAAKKLAPARVVAQYSHQYRLATPWGDRFAEVSGKYAFAAASPGDYPAVGDWVAAELPDGGSPAVIHALLPRRTSIVRRAAGSRPDEQIIGANLDAVFIVASLNEDWNLRRIERYLIAVREGGAQPVLLLTKADLCDAPDRYVEEARAIAPDVPVFAVSALLDRGRDMLAPYVTPGMTVGATGSSGVGKSTLLNWLAGERHQVVQDIREDDARGRHTTTHRELFLLPSGAIWLDTPGMRELQLWESEEGWQATFSDIEALAASCRFRDCRHGAEQGCAVREALEAGELDEGRYANYRKTERELARLALKEQRAGKRSAKEAAGRGGKSAAKDKKQARRPIVTIGDED